MELMGDDTDEEEEGAVAIYKLKNLIIYIIYGFHNKYKPKLWWFMYTYHISTMKLATRLLVFGTNFGESFLRSGQQFEGIQNRYLVLLNKVFGFKEAN